MYQPQSIGFKSYDEWWLALGRDAGIPYSPPHLSGGDVASKLSSLSLIGVLALLIVGAWWIGGKKK